MSADRSPYPAVDAWTEEPRAFPAARCLARTTFLMTAAQIEFLDRLSARARRDAGARITKRMILETLIALVPPMELPLREAGSETRLKELLRERTRGAEPRAHAAAPPRNRHGMEHDEECPRRSLSIQLSNVALATLQLVAAEIRHETGTAIGMSGVVRALVRWLAEVDLETSRIHRVDDLRRQLQARPAPSGAPG